MLENSFIHLPGVGEQTEKKLWDTGILTWYDFLNSDEEKLPVRIRANHKEILSQCIEHKDDLEFLAEAFPAQEHWRLFSKFSHLCSYFDIETDGRQNQDSITAVTVYDSRGTKTFVRGVDLEYVSEYLESCGILVSFYGTHFDLPMLQSNLGFQNKRPHIDLYHVFRSLDIRGGLKKIESRFGIDRGTLSGVDGYYAVLLWRYYKNMSDERALETLLAYNVEDVVNLEELLYIAYNLKIDSLKRFTDQKKQWSGSRPPNPFNVSRSLLQEVRAYLNGVRY